LLDPCVIFLTFSACIDTDFAQVFANFKAREQSSCWLLLGCILQSETGVVMSGKQHLTGFKTDAATVLQPNPINKFLLIRPKTDEVGCRISGRYVASYGCYTPPDMRLITGKHNQAHMIAIVMCDTYVTICNILPIEDRPNFQRCSAAVAHTSECRRSGNNSNPLFWVRACVITG
jgi:hypothetical protein